MSKLLSFIKKKFRKDHFSSSKDYWEERYSSGNNSGRGSYKRLAEFKAEVLNNFVENYSIDKVIEFGCGDGNQLMLYNFPAYIGIDVSKMVVEKCESLYEDDDTKSFQTLADFEGADADIAVSIDVIYHLVEDPVFENHLKLLFESASKYVIIYSSNEDIYNPKVPHVKHRQFTDYINEEFPEAELINHIPNKFSYDPKVAQTSRADFFIYKVK